jgi:hypothetical protein
MANDYTGQVVIPLFFSTVQANNTAWEADLSMPLFQVSGLVEHNTGDVILPLIEVSGTHITGAWAIADISIPLFTSAGTAQLGTFADIEIPLFTVAGDLFEQPVLAGDIVIPLFYVDGLMSRGAVGWLTTSPHAAWVVNKDTVQHSTYSNWQVNSLVQFNGTTLLALPDGIYEETGDVDGTDQIDFKLYWPPTEFGKQVQKRVDAVYVNGRFLGNFRVVSLCDETQKRVYTQDMTNFPVGAHPKRALFTRNLMGRYWQIGIENALGSRITIADLEAMPIEHQRRLR